MGGEVLQNLQWEERPGNAYEPTSYITVAGTISKFVGYGSRPNPRATSQICSTAFSSSLISLSSITLESRRFSSQRIASERDKHLLYRRSARQQTDLYGLGDR